ncbi:hypothetical protein EDB83DRAFT_236335 [Lactarius deliciosus]|nr:hypothetical protein EDB83DRAFT_236335 [Lactarius deliciosus]
MPAPAQEINATIIPNCSCQRCSDAQRRQPAWYPTEQRDVRSFIPKIYTTSGLTFSSKNTVAPYANRDQSIGDNVETDSIAPVRSWAQFVPPQTAVSADIRFTYTWLRSRQGIQGNFGYAPDLERAGPPNEGLLRAPWPDASIAEGRRRLADCYLNNPDAFVRMIRLEPGASGQSQVIIVLEIPNIL